MRASHRQPPRAARAGASPRRWALSALPRQQPSTHGRPQRAAPGKRSRSRSRSRPPVTGPKAVSWVTAGQLTYSMPMPNQQPAVHGGPPCFDEPPSHLPPDEAFLRRLGLEYTPGRTSHDAGLLLLGSTTHLAERLSHGQISRAIATASSWEALAELLEQQGDELSHLHVTHMLYKLSTDFLGPMRAALSAAPRRDAEAGTRGAQWALGRLSDLLLSHLMWLDAAALAHAPLSLAKLGWYDAALVAVLCEAALEQAAAFEARHVACLLRALVLLPASPAPGWLNSFLDATRATLDAAGERELSGVLWAAAKLRVAGHDAPSASWLASALDATRPLLAGARPQFLATVAWAAGRLHARPVDDWLQQFTAASEVALPRFAPRDLAHMAWGLGEMRGAAPTPGWTFRLCDRAAQLLGGMASEEVAQLLFGLSQIHVHTAQRAERAAAVAAAAAAAVTGAEAAMTEAAAPATDAAALSSRERRRLRAEAAQQLLTHAALQMAIPALGSYPPSCVGSLVAAAAELAAPEQASEFAAHAAAALAPHWGKRAVGRPHWERHCRRTLARLGVASEMLPACSECGGAAPEGVAAAAAAAAAVAAPPRA